jgi:hypothetical protein
MNEEELKDFCAWNKCKLESSTILKSIGICDDHLARYFRESPNLKDEKWLHSKLKREAKACIKEIEKNDA